MNKGLLGSILIFLLTFILIISNLNTLMELLPGRTPTEDEFIPLTGEEKLLARDVLLSREYELKLYTPQFQRLDDGMVQLHKKLAYLMGIDELTLPGNKSIRHQFSYNSGVCGTKLSLRLRKFFNTTNLEPLPIANLDIKSAEHGVYNWEIAPIYRNNSIKKSETDIHVCKTKNSIDSRVEVPFDFELRTCKDIIDVFPSTKDFIDPSKHNSELEIAENYDGWWYEVRHEGILKDARTEYINTVNIEYSSLESLLNNTIDGMSYPEWSFRIFSDDGGNGLWIKSTIRDIDSRFQYLIDNKYIPSMDYDCLLGDNDVDDVGEAHN